MRKLRLLIYDLLVNRRPGIAERYHRVHDGSRGIRKVLSWVWLFVLNLCYYVFFCRFLGERTGTLPYEKKRLPLKESESSLFIKGQIYTGSDGYLPGAGHILDRVKGYDVISFDIFDTLIFRPFDDPTTVFDLIGQEYGVLDFRSKRQLAEYRERAARMEAFGDNEISLADIWRRLGAELGIDPEEGMSREERCELSLCRANPVMSRVWQVLKEEGRCLIVTSDMYLPEDTIRKLLEKNGYTGYDRLYLSNVLHLNKAGGNLYERIKSDYPGKRVIHIGDNPSSDEHIAVKHGIDAVLYPNVNILGGSMRAADMSRIVGSAYRGLVNSRLYNGRQVYSRLYEYGYVYGGLFVTGYCSFIHRYAQEHGTDRILFLSRDGDILKKAYDLIYGRDDNRTCYIFWSRKAALKLGAGYDREDYLRRFLYHKTGQGISTGNILSSMGLGAIADALLSEEAVEKAKARMKREYGSETGKLNAEELSLSGELNGSNVWLLRCVIEEYWDEILKVYEDEAQAAGAYLKSLIGDARNIAAVDVGWAGSGAVTLSRLCRERFGMDVEMTGIVAGTNSIHNQDSDASESFIQSGKIVSYMYSQSENRDLYKKHDPARDYNVFWELLLSSKDPAFSGFRQGRTAGARPVSFEAVLEHEWHDPPVYSGGELYVEDVPADTLSEKGVTLIFGSTEFNASGIGEIQEGIMDFVKQYTDSFRDYPQMMNISGRDAYAPVLAAASYRERYLRSIAEEFRFEKNVV